MGSKHFVHGGAMLQEIVVPVITVRHIKGKAVAATKTKTVVVTAKANAREPWVYLKPVLTERPRASTVEQIEALLPWKIEHPEL